MGLKLTGFKIILLKKLATSAVYSNKPTY